MGRVREEGALGVAAVGVGGQEAGAPEGKGTESGKGL